MGAKPVLEFSLSSGAVVELPTRKFRRLIHRGHLSGDYRIHQKPSSHEGPLLSCSNREDVDEAWLAIAKLGGLPRWIIKKTSGSLVVADVHAIAPDQRIQILDQAVENGFVRRASGYKVSWVDEDEGDERYFLFSSSEKASADAEMEEEGRTLTQVPILEAAPPLIDFWNARHGGNSVDIASVEDAALATVIESALPGIDGLFWDDDLDPLALSAPRVGLFQRTLCEIEKVVEGQPQ